MALLLVVLAVVVDVALGARLRGQIEDRLRDRTAATASLMGTVDATELADRLSAQGLAVRIDEASGDSIVAGPTPEQLRGGPVGPPGGPRGSETPAAPAPGAVRVTASKLSGDADLVSLQSTLSDGSRLTLTASAAGVGETLAQVRWIMAGASAVVLILAAGAVILVVRATLVPLDVVSEVARAIAAGERGRRLRPTHPDTEIGRVAMALDDMLDDVVGAEVAALAAEKRLRAFLSDAAHELRTPVAGIRAAADTLVRAELDGPEREVLAGHVVREATRASRLVDDLLLMARVDRGLELSVADADLRDIVAAEVDRARLVHPELTVRTDLSDAEVPVAIDRDRIAQVLSNLVENAARVTGGRGRVTLGIHSSADDVEVRVQDDGPGVAPEEYERIFDRLVRLDSSRAGSGGVGLGLPIARGIARAHGGDVACVAVESGALFVLRLPWSAISPAQRAERAGVVRAGVV